MPTLVEILPYLQEFVRRLVERDLVKRVILFGSYARGTAERTSDVDLIVVSRAEREVRAIIDSVNEKLASAGFAGRLDAQVVSGEELSIEYLTDGIQLWGNPICVTTRKMLLKRQFIVCYDTSGMTSIARGRLYRALYGHRTQSRRGKKIYRSERRGLVRPPNAERFGTSALLLKPELLDDVLETIRTHGAKAKVLEVWKA